MTEMVIGGTEQQPPLHSRQRLVPYATQIPFTGLLAGHAERLCGEERRGGHFVVPPHKQWVSPEVEVEVEYGRVCVEDAKGRAVGPRGGASRCEGRGSRSHAGGCGLWVYQERLQCTRAVLEEPVHHATKEWVWIALQDRTSFPPVIRLW